MPAKRYDPRRLERNLRNLLAQLHELGRGDPGRQSTAISSVMPLSHSTGKGPFRSIVEQGRLVSAEGLSALGLRPPPEEGEPSVEATLGTADSVFRLTTGSNWQNLRTLSVEYLARHLGWHHHD